MPTTAFGQKFAVGDRVRVNPEGAGEDHYVDGTVVGFNKSASPIDALVYIERDDGVEGSGPGRSWMCCPKNLTAIPEYVILAVDESVSDYKGYVPDGFDAEAHRSFMKTLGGGS